MKDNPSTPKVLTNRFLKNPMHYIEIHSALNRLDCSSREIPDFMTLTMSEIGSKHDLRCIHIPHWHHLGCDDDAKTIRNIMRSNTAGLPASQSRQLDLLNYMSMCLQHVDQLYAEYVQKWSHSEIMCLNEED